MASARADARSCRPPYASGALAGLRHWLRCGAFARRGAQPDESHFVGASPRDRLDFGHSSIRPQMRHNPPPADGLVAANRLQQFFGAGWLSMEACSHMKRPRHGTTTERVWQICDDDLTRETKEAALRSDVITRVISAELPAQY